MSDAYEHGAPGYVHPPRPITYELDFNAAHMDTKQFHFGIGFAWNHPEELCWRGKRAWRAVLVPDLFGPVWIWKPVY